MPTPTKEQILVKAIAETIQEAGEIPSGVLYAQLMSGITLDVYLMIIDSLKKNNLVTESNHLLKWVGPPKAPTHVQN